MKITLRDGATFKRRYCSWFHQGIAASHDQMCEIVNTLTAEVRRLREGWRQEMERHRAGGADEEALNKNAHVTIEDTNE